MTINCQWNATWDRDVLDPCLWTQCIFIPEPPPEANMLFTPDDNQTLYLLSGKRLDGPLAEDL